MYRHASGDKGSSRVTGECGKVCDLFSLKCKDMAVKIGEDEVKEVAKFQCLGSLVFKDGSASEEIRRRIGKSSGAFSNLFKVWKRKNLGLKTKIRIYDATVLSVVI